MSGGAGKPTTGREPLKTSLQLNEPRATETFEPRLRRVSAASMTAESSQGPPWSAPPPVHPLFLSRLTPSADLAAAVFLMFAGGHARTVASRCVADVGRDEVKSGQRLSVPPGAASVLGNGTVLLVYCRKRKLRIPELMTINLAVCDLGFSLLGVPFFITSR